MNWIEFKYKCMIKNWIYIVLSWVVPHMLLGQTVTPALISSSGSQVITDQLELQWSLGEVYISQSLHADLQLSAGFHQNLFESGSTSQSAIAESGFRVYPNPTSNLLQVDVQDHTQIEFSLQDALGNSLIKGSFRLRTYLNISTLPPGIYILRISKGAKRYGIRKIIKI